MTPTNDIPTPDRWEDLCQRCGGCCFEKIIDDRGRVITTSTPCRYLDIHDRTCRIYANRQQIEPDCIKLTPENVAQFDWLPDDCAYRNLADKDFVRTNKK